MFIFENTKMLPKPLQNYIRKYYLVGIGFLVLSIIFLFIPSFRGAIPLSLLLSLVDVLMGYLAERAIAKKGYNINSYYVEQYTTKHNIKPNTPMFFGGGIKGIDLKSTNPLDDKIYHLGIPNDKNHIPQLGWIIDIYTRPKSSPVYINGKYYITEFYTKEYRTKNSENTEESIENN